MHNFKTPDWWLKNNKILAFSNNWHGDRILSFNMNHLKLSSTTLRLEEIVLKAEFNYFYAAIPCFVFLLSQVTLFLLRKKEKIEAIEVKQNVLNELDFPLGLDKIIPFIETYFFKRNFSALDVAQALKVSESEVELEVEKKTGMRFKDYLQLLRVSMAKELLTTTSDKAFEIALKTGFNNAANFSQVFKQVTGETPNSYRKRM